MKIALYYAPVACPLVPFVTLTEAGADFEVKTINLRKQHQKSLEYMQINPKHKVPLLVIDGKSLSENIAIQLWIARAFPQARLLPSDPWEELQAISMLSWFASSFHPHLSRINSPQNFCDVDGAEDSVARLAKNYLIEQFGIAEAMLAGREFFFDHFTTADAYFFWCFRRAQLLEVDVSTFTACIKHFEEMKKRASIQSVLAFEVNELNRISTM